jgi:hypothetical protein
MPFVVDASVAACWLTLDERHAVAEGRLRGSRGTRSRRRVFGGSNFATC